MSRVPRKNSAQELIVRKYLFRHKIRYRIHSRIGSCTPDIVINTLKTVIFIHGCFWHGHPNCHLSKRPKSNRLYWERKINENIIRDFDKTKELQSNGWSVITIWQCELRNKDQREKTLNKLLIQLTKSRKMD